MVISGGDATNLTLAQHLELFFGYQRLSGIGFGLCPCGDFQPAAMYGNHG